MKNKLFTLVLAAVVIVSLVVVGCAKPAPAPAPSPAPAPAPSPAPTPAPAGPEEILLGCNASMTGYAASFSNANEWGEQAAVDDINKQGGVYVEEYGRRIPVKLVVYDNESDPNKAKTLEEQLVVRDKVHLLVDSNTLIPITFPEALVAEQYKVPRVSGGAPMEAWLGLRNELETPFEYTWTWGFSIATPAPSGSYWDKPGYVLIDIWKVPLDKYSDQTNKRVGVIATDEPDGRGWYALFPPTLKEWGYDVIGIEDNLGLFPLGTTDFASLIKRWQDNEVEILWGNCPSPEFATLWRQCHTMGFHPKMVFMGRAPMFYTDVASWGGDLPLGVCTELWWDPCFQNCPGIGGTTPQSLAERWSEETGQVLSPSIGWGYQQMQTMIDAIERAGSLDREKVNKALADTNLQTIDYLVKYDENHCNLKPEVFCQWQKTDSSEVWKLEVVYSDHKDIPVTAEMIFPIPYE